MHKLIKITPFIRKEKRRYGSIIKKKWELQDEKKKNHITNNWQKLQSSLEYNKKNHKKG